MTRESQPIDAIVGRSIRARRLALGMTQTDLANAVGVKFQQVQKYETGFNRVSASRLFEIAETLKCSVIDLYGDAVFKHALKSRKREISQ